MPRERADFRDNLERVLQTFPGGELIPLKQAAAFVGVDPRTLRGSDCPIKQVGRMYYVPAVGLARWLS